MPTLGKTSVGATSGPLNANQQYANGPYTATESGTITSISLHANSVTGTPTARFGAWLDNGAGYPGDLVAESAGATPVVGLNTFAASGPLVSGQSYYIGWLSTGSLNNPYDAGTKEIVLRNETAGPLTDPYGAGGTEVGSRDYTMYLTYDAAAAMSITISSPGTRRLFQRNGAVASIPITGNAVGFTGAIEARLAGGAWQTITTITDDGAYSGTLTGQALTAGTLEVRSVTEPTVIASVADVMTGRLYLVTGDSISEGRLDNAQFRGSANAVAYRQNDAWVMADDPIDTGTIGGSHWPLLAQYLTAHFGHPVGFITTGTGSTDIAGNSTHYSKPNAGWDIITSQVAEAGGAIEAALVHLGPNGAVGDTLTQAQYLTALTTWAADLRSDVQAGLQIFLGVYGRSAGTQPGNPKIRRAIAEAIATGIMSCGPNLLGPNWGDGVHPETDADAALTAGRWFAALTGVASPRIKKAVLNTDPTIVDLAFRGQLGGNNGDAYTVSLFTVNGVNPTSATRINATTVRLVFAAARAAGQSMVYVPAEQHIGGTMPSSVVVDLPVTIHSVSTAVQPADPVILTVVAAGNERSGSFASPARAVARSVARSVNA